MADDNQNPNTDSHSSASFVSSLLNAGVLGAHDDLVRQEGTNKRRIEGQNEASKDEEDTEKTRPLSAKRTKAVVSSSSPSVTDDLICPITLELPFEPVTASDGIVYEESAISKHIATARDNGQTLRSPVTNEPMKVELFPSPRTKNVIQSLIDNGVIVGNFVNTWNSRIKQEKAKKTLLQKAEAGDAASMFRVGWRYACGVDGFKQSDALAFSWYKRAHNAGNVEATLLLGLCYAGGKGVQRNLLHAAAYLGIAAGQGSDEAAYVLGEAYTGDLFSGMTDHVEAIRWLEKSLDPNCTVQHLVDYMKDTARQKLKELREQSSSED